ncbi:MAG: hypothetical protein LBF12_01535 [Christensenellaceae bacterium]|jgi:hypothetical protein|nr:hypothetical protein [Christensenellaceae bacterium]
MDFSLETIKREIKELPEKEFLIKYILRSNNWYFSIYLQLSENDAIAQLETLKEILNAHMGVAFHNILLVGSSKIGCSLAPYKKFKKFDEEADNHSDIDIAIISSKLFNQLWDTIRHGYYKIKDRVYYARITSSIFRGFINEKDFINIDELRPQWNSRIDRINKDIQKKIAILHPINYRIYRSWEDLEDYHILGIQKLKKSI